MKNWKFNASYLIIILLVMVLLGFSQECESAEPFTGTEASASFSQVIDGTAESRLDIRLSNYMSNFAIGAFASTKENFGPAFIWRVFETHFTEKKNIGMAFHLAANSDLWQGQEETNEANMIYEVEPRLIWTTIDNAVEIGFPISYATRKGNDAVWAFGLTLNFHPSKR